MSAPHTIFELTVCHLCAKNFHSWWKFDEVLTKIILHSFSETRCIARARP